MHDWKGYCHRCGRRVYSFTMSYFNTDLICNAGEGNCTDRERTHPKYHEARDAEHSAVLAGNMNFPGIGKPSDL